jgi:hypothetical protein
MEICARSEARNRISLMTPGQASASTQICMKYSFDEVNQIILETSY